MAWSIGTFTFPAGEIPINDSSLPFDGGEQRWSEFDPVGSNKTILTYLGTKSPVYRLRALVLEASKNALKVIYDARAEVTFVNPYSTVTVAMTRFVAVKHPIPLRWEVFITLVGR